MTRHITHVITKLDVGGAQTHVVELAIGQRDAGEHVDVVAGGGGPAAVRLTNAGLGVHVVPELGESHGRLGQRAAIRAVTGTLRRIRPDIVHGHSSHAGLAARLAARRLGIPSVYTAHGWPFQKGAAWRQRVVSFAGEFVGGHVGDAVIVLTPAERDRALRARITARDRLWIVPNGIADVGAVRRPVPEMCGRSPALVMVARFAPPKLQQEVVDALAELRDLAWTMTFVGDGPQQRSCERRVSELGLGDRISFLGHRDDVAEVLAASDVGILWSRYEGQPISVIEYLRAGLCCVCSDLPGTRELLGQPPAGVLGESVSALRSVVAQPSMIDRHGAAARARFESEYSAAAMVAATARVYASVLRER